MTISTSDVAVGIDLGTTYSAIAVMTDAGRIEVIRNIDNETTTPSVVLFDPSEPEPIVGREAKNLGAAMPQRVVESVKRFMGSDVKWEFDGRIYTPSEVSSFILRKLKCDAEHRLGRALTDAVISVPAYFAHKEREDTKRAAILAGLNEPLLILNEPTAVAIAFRVERMTGAETETVLVYDLGGGTFDVTVLDVTPEGLQVRTTDGDVRLGGKDWDDLVIEHVAKQFQDAYGRDPREDADTYQTLVIDAEAAKRRLSEASTVRIACSLRSQRLQVPITREQFEQFSLPLLERTRSTTKLVIHRAGLSQAQISRVLLVGGSTRMPMVRQLLSGMFPGRLDTTIHPDECVAIGAAIQAARHQGRGAVPAGEHGRRAVRGMGMRELLTLQR